MKPSGSTSLASKITETEHRQQPHAHGDGRHQDVGAAKHAGQSRAAVRRARAGRDSGAIRVRVHGSRTASPGASRRSSGATASTSPRSVRQTSRSWPGVVRTSTTSADQRPVVGHGQRRSAYGDARVRPRVRRRPSSRGGGVTLEDAGVAEEERRLRRRPAPARRRAIGPDWTIRPARITARSSATVNASSWSWVTITAVVPASTRIRRRSSARRCRSPASRALSGSSRSSSRGDAARARARATRCRSPPDRVAGSRSANPDSPTRSSSSATRAAAAARGVRRMRRG